MIIKAVVITMIDNLNLDDVYTVERIVKTVPTSEFYENFVDLEYTGKLCRECNMYNNNWGCPEIREDVSEYWTRYDNIKLIALKLNFTDEFRQKSFNIDEIIDIVDMTLFKEKSRILSELMAKEAEADGLVLSAGFCDICEECSRINDEPCRFPDKVRHSIESIGTLVNKTLTDVFGFELESIDFENGRFPEYLTLLTALLY